MDQGFDFLYKQPNSLLLTYNNSIFRHISQVDSIIIDFFFRFYFCTFNKMLVKSYFLFVTSELQETETPGRPMSMFIETDNETFNATAGHGRSSVAYR